MAERGEQGRRIRPRLLDGRGAAPAKGLREGGGEGLGTGGAGGEEAGGAEASRQVTVPGARAFVALVLLGLAGCGSGSGTASAGLYPNETPELRALIEAARARYGVPTDLVQRVVVRESRHVPAARNGPYYGLMQIHPQTARTMG